jgi:hypothetical protein
MKKPVSKILVVVAAGCAALAFLTTVEAQRYRTPRARGYTKDEVNSIIKRVETRTDEFVKLFDKSLDRSGLDGTAREDNLNEKAKNLEKATDELRSEFDRKESYIATRPEAARCLSIAGDINVAMRRRRMGGQTERQWALLRAELNELARVYNLPRIR